MVQGRVVDLSHRLLPGREEYGLELITHRTDELYPRFQVSSDVWYILQDIHMSSHCGTHIEFPYHHKRGGMDAGSFPLQRLIGDAVLLDFTHKKPGDAVTVSELQDRGARIREGDMVLFNFDCARFYRTEHAHDRPYLETDAVEWLVQEKRINLIGSDATGIEVKGVPDQPNHQYLMDHEVPIIESAAHFELLRRDRFTLFVLALRVEGLDSCPVRLIALEDA
jgi:arylformamidase